MSIRTAGTPKPKLFDVTRRIGYYNSPSNHNPGKLKDDIRRFFNNFAKRNGFNSLEKLMSKPENREALNTVISEYCNGCKDPSIKIAFQEVLDEYQESEENKNSPVNISYNQMIGREITFVDKETLGQTAPVVDEIITAHSSIKVKT